MFLLHGSTVSISCEIPSREKNSQRIGIRTAFEAVKRVQGQKIQRGRAVDQDVVVIFADLGQCGMQARFTLVALDQVKVCGNKVLVCRKKP